MILVGSQRGGAGNLARHLLNTQENDHVTVQELRGFTARDLLGAFEEAHAVSLGTRCKQFLFSLSLNPPKDADIGLDDLLRAADRAEERLGLKDQPRAVVVHEKNGRRHAHVVWSRIDGEKMQAINLPYYKTRLNDLSKNLYLEHGWDLPEGYKENGWKNPLNFTLAEWQQARRLDLDPREIKQVFRQAWTYADSPQSFRAALEDSGYFLARGDRRGFVAVDIHGEVFSVARMAGVKTKDLNARLGDPDRLPGVDTVRDGIQKRLSQGLRTHLKASRQQQQEALTPLLVEKQELVSRHRQERQKLDQGLTQRARAEAQARSARLRTGLRGVIDFMTGRAARMRRQNESEAYQGFLRDRSQREALHKDHARETSGIHERIAALKANQRQDSQHLAAKIGQMLRLTRDQDSTRQTQRQNPRERGPDLSP